MSGVTEDEDVCVGLIIGSAIEVYDDVAPVLVTSDIESVGIGLTGVVKRIEIGDGRCGENSFKLRGKTVVSARADGSEAFQLAERQSVDGDLFSCQLHRHLGLKLGQLLPAIGTQLNEHSTVKEWFFVLSHLG